MRYTELLTESRMQDISLDRLKQLLPEYSQALNAKPIYRGLDDPDDPFTFKIAGPDTRLGRERMAANTNNHSNMIVSNAKAWRKFPQRNRSFICTSDYGYAGAYGSVYQILPRNNTKLGVCGDIDFWDSFRTLSQQGVSFIELNEALAKIGWMAGQNGLNDTDYDIFKKQLNDLPEERFYLEETTDKLYTYALAHGMEPSAALEDWLDPIKNGFKLQGIAQFNSYDREVWFSNECLVIHPEYMEQLRAL